MILLPMNANPLKRGTKLEKSIFSDTLYRAEVKWDGYRQLWVDGRMLSRGLGVDGVQHSKSAWVPHISRALEEAAPGYWFDGELLLYPNGRSHDVTRVMQSKQPRAIEQQQEYGWLTYMIFDVLRTPEGECMSWPFEARRALLEQIFTQALAGCPHIQLSPIYDDIEEALQFTKENGYEGIMLKNKSGLWVPGRLGSDCRPAHNWYKIKHEIPTEDCVIIGYVEPSKYYVGPDGKQDKGRLTKYYERNWIGGIKIGQYRNGVLVPVGSVSGITEELRASISAQPEQYMGRVVEIRAFTRNETGHFTSPVFVRFRTDKRPAECVWLD